MKEATKAALFFIPRFLTLMFAIFLSMFALDVFQAGLGLWATMRGLLLHLIPTAVVLLLLALAWRHGWVGALAYAALGVFIIVTKSSNVGSLLGVAAPLFLISVMFLIDWLVSTGDLRPA
jgi:hypothetical protein